MRPGMRAGSLETPITSPTALGQSPGLPPNTLEIPHLCFLAPQRNSRNPAGDLQPHRAPGARFPPPLPGASHLPARVGASPWPPPRRPRGLRPAGRQSRGPAPCPRVPAVPPAVRR